jgi:hypothetical protein
MMTSDADVDRARSNVLDFLRRLEARDVEAAKAYIAERCRFVFPGGREPDGVDAIVAQSARRYRRIGKVVERAEAYATSDGVVVYVTGVLQGEWDAGGTFDSIRFIDRFLVVDGRIRLQEVWNDAGEHRLRAASA